MDFGGTVKAKSRLEEVLGRRQNSDSALKKIFCEGEQRNDLGA